MRVVVATLLFCLFGFSDAQAHAVHRQQETGWGDNSVAAWSDPYYAKVKTQPAVKGFTIARRGDLDRTRSPVHLVTNKIQDRLPQAQSQAPSFAPVTHQEATQVVAHPSGCPARLFCGCGTALELLGVAVRKLWWVPNWYAFPKVSPAAGTAAIFGTHHVAAVRQVDGDRVLLYDPNSGGGLTRVHWIPISRVTAFVDPRGARL
jgi:hypothetical protein